MAQTRSLRQYTTISSPPTHQHQQQTQQQQQPSSPRLSEKKHHSRRKSGRDYHVNTDRSEHRERKSSRPAPPLSRRTTPQFITKSSSSGRSEERERERERIDGGESFPQFCMTCEKQFLPANNTFLYCSETCRLHDQSSAPTHPHPNRNSTQFYPSQSPPLTPYHPRQFTSSSYTTPSYEEGPDIIPRFSPTQSRPRSYFNSDPYPSTYSHPSQDTDLNHDTALSSSPSHTQSSTSALESLRELATALPKTSSRHNKHRERRRERHEPESPPKSSASSISRTGSGVWDYIHIPFTSTSTSSRAPTPSATPVNSYTGSQSYGGVKGLGLDTYGASGYSGSASGKVGGGAGGYTTTRGMGMDRPLPPRSGPGGYGHRPRSIDLVTPFSGR